MFKPKSEGHDVARDSRRAPLLTIDTRAMSDSDEEPNSANSLFDEPRNGALQHAPAIPGLYVVSRPLPQDLALSTLESCMAHFFPTSNPDVNQVMLFGKGIHPFLLELLDTLDVLLLGQIPPETHSLVFPPAGERANTSRQAIINLYHPGEGISSHVDLLDRFGDGIIGVSLGSSCVMRFARDEEVHDVFLPERSVLVLSDEARYDWTHGIKKKTEDFVEPGEWIPRGTRVSVTFRWLLPGADVVGGV